MSEDFSGPKARSVPGCPTGNSSLQANRAMCLSQGGRSSSDTVSTAWQTEDRPSMGS